MIVITKPNFCLKKDFPMNEILLGPLAISFSLCLGLISPVAAVAQATNALAGFGTPTVDGRFSPGEWQTAASLDFEVRLPEGGTTPGHDLCHERHEQSLLWHPLRPLPR